MEQIVYPGWDGIIGKLDPLLVELVDLLRKVPGVTTFDSCFGHGEGHDTPMTYIYIGLGMKDESQFMKFFAFIFDKTFAGYGKVFLSDERYHGSGFTIGLHRHELPNLQSYYYRLHIDPMTWEVEKEKNAGIEWLCDLIEEYLAR